MLAVDRWYSPGSYVASMNRSNFQDINYILMKVELNTQSIDNTRPRGV